MRIKAVFINGAAAGAPVHFARKNDGLDVIDLDEMENYISVTLKRNGAIIEQWLIPRVFAILVYEPIPKSEMN